MGAKLASGGAAKALAGKLLGHIRRRRNDIAQQIQRLRKEASTLAGASNKAPK